jgi:hypothetical protein
MAYEPPDIETMDDAALQLNEWYKSLVRSGFTRHEALHLVMGEPCCNREDT